MGTVGTEVCVDLCVCVCVYEHKLCVCVFRFDESQQELSTLAETSWCSHGSAAGIKPEVWGAHLQPRGRHKDELTLRHTVYECNERA